MVVLCSVRSGIKLWQVHPIVDMKVITTATLRSTQDIRGLGFSGSCLRVFQLALSLTLQLLLQEMCSTGSFTTLLGGSALKIFGLDPRSWNWNQTVESQKIESNGERDYATYYIYEFNIFSRKRRQHVKKIV